MSVFDLFRGFFGVPRGRYGGEGRRDPFFDGMTHDDDDDDDDEENGFYHDSFRGVQQDPFDDAWRFGFSFGPGGMRIEEPAGLGQVFREMEEIFSQFGSLGGHPGADRHFGVPSIQPAPPQDRSGDSGGSSSRNSLRDFMLKSPDDGPRRGLPAGLPAEPRDDDPGAPRCPSTPFNRWTPFPKFSDIWRGRPQRGAEEERKEDGDLDSQVSSGSLDQILTPPPAHTPSQPRIRSFFQSVTVTKVVKPDGSVEERRTVRDGQGNEETTVTQSGGPGNPPAPQDHTGPLLPGGQYPFPDLHDNFSVYSKFFGGFKG